MNAGFPNRASAGRLLAARLVPMRLPDPVVLALPRGGVPVGFEIAKALHAPLDLLLVRKIGVPAQPELAAGAVVDGDSPDLVLNEDVMLLAGVDKAMIDDLAARELKEIERRRRAYLAGRPPIPVAGRSVIVVDDGVATGASMRAGLAAIARHGPKRLILAVPVAPRETISELRPLVNEVVCLLTPEPFCAIGNYYSDFHQLSDEEVTSLMRSLQA